MKAEVIGDHASGRLKHDLRLADHAPLMEAVAHGDDLLLLYVVEPERLDQPDESMLHVAWDLANARTLLARVEALGGTCTSERGALNRCFKTCRTRRRSSASTVMRKRASSGHGNATNG